MISFESDYNNGMLPEIIENLSKTNDDKTSGYGFDPYSESAKNKIRKAIGKEKADVYFLISGTQTNTTVIDSLLLGCEGVILSPALYQALSKLVAFEVWEKRNEQEIICRFVTSWATKEEELEELDKALERCLS